MRTTIPAFLAALILPGLSMAAADEAKTITATHTLGTVELPVNPKRVAVLDYGSLETIGELGVTPALALPKKFLPPYLSKFSGEQYTDLGTVKEFNIETINAFKPDLIIISGRQQDYYQKLSSIAPVYLVDTLAKDQLGEAKKNIRLLGDVFGVPEKAAEAVKNIDEAVTRTKDKAQASGKKALVLLTNDGKVSAYGSGSRFGLVHDALGVAQADKNIKVGVHGQQVTYEYIAMLNPDIIFVVDDHLTTLMDFRYKRKYVAPEGGKGGASLCHGKNAENLVIKVPLGTVIKDAESGLVIADLSDHTPVTIAKGGRGGYGNAHFATPTRQIPKFAKPGMPGEDIQVTLELKLIADVGLIGFPNVGKSTLISTISAAKPKIANYHFTTLVPTLGVVSVGEGASFVCADIPGLIEGASEGIGLGHDFLRHVERCRLLLHVVDVSGSECREPVDDFEKINEELAKFSPELAKRPQIVVGNKCDLATEEQIEAFRTYVEGKGLTFVPISAATMQGVRELPGLVYNRLKDIPPVPVFTPEYKKPEPKANDRAFTIKRMKAHVWSVEAPWLEYILAGSNVDDYESLQYFQRQLGESGILDALVQKGVEENDTILIGEYQFDYIF